ncbi:PAS domain-containing protein [Pelagibius marinus]|uniref:PAS domain-containing protein n=1 Tax=Pelagibius marinus TaxID=2762760 RepID=UPI001872C6B6|nr:PAS domain-containing protein [Pelagibius marinus]
MNAPKKATGSPQGGGGKAASQWPENLQDKIGRENLSADHMRAAYDYWWQTRGELELPPADAIDPLRMPRACLPFIVILEVEASPLRFRCRLTGTRVVDSLGVDLTGLYIDELPNIEKPLARMAWCVRERRPYLVEDAVTFAPNDYRRYRTMALPFGDGGQGVERIVFVFDFDVHLNKAGEDSAG